MTNRSEGRRWVLGVLEISTAMTYIAEARIKETNETS